MRMLQSFLEIIHDIDETPYFFYEQPDGSLHTGHFSNHRPSKAVYFCPLI